MIKCFKCGECCRELVEVIITKQEYKLLKKYGKVEVTTNGKGKLKMKLPCVFQDGNKCTIYDMRPCMCRMWHCGRVKPEDKKLKWISDIQDLMVTNPGYKEFKINMEDKAVEWGNAHGWNWRR